MNRFPVSFGEFRNRPVQHLQIRIMSIRYGFQNLQISVSPLIPHPFPQQIIADRNNDPLNPGGKSSRITVKTGAFFPCPNECRLNGIIRIGMRIDDLKRNFPV